MLTSRIRKPEIQRRLSLDVCLVGWRFRPTIEVVNRKEAFGGRPQPLQT
jgi:hypothetical protein